MSPGWFSFLMFLTACTHEKQDLVLMTEDVETKNRGVDIKITPIEKNDTK